MRDPRHILQNQSKTLFYFICDNSMMGNFVVDLVTCLHYEFHSISRNFFSTSYGVGSSVVK
jgi:hypothetical protein